MIRERRMMGAMPWGEFAVLAGLWLAVAAYVVPKALIGPTAQMWGGESEYADLGTIFEKAGAVAEYADLRLARSVPNALLPDPPQIVGSVVAARVAWAMAIVSAGLFIWVSLIASRQSWSSFTSHVGLRRFSFDALWVPGLAVAIVYLAIGAYMRLVAAAGIDSLQGDPAVLDGTIRDATAMGLYGLLTVVVAPVAEEVFYRGFVFGGLISWGFWPAAVVSGSLFALSHLDSATLIPFALVGVVVCWLYWRSGSLWDAIAFHMLFNFLSFILLLART